MAIKRERETSKTVVLDETKNKIKETKETSKKKDKVVDKKKQERFLSPKGLKEEYSKIDWPEPKRIARETIWIIFFLVITAAMIAFVDLGVYHFITNVSKTDKVQSELTSAFVGMGIAVVAVGLIFYLLRERTSKKK